MSTRLVLVSNAKMLNACREDISRFLSPTAFKDSPSVASSLSQPLQGTKSNPRFFQSPTRCLPVLWLLRTLVERVSRQACPDVRRRKCYSRLRSKSQHVHLTLIHRRSSLATCPASSVSELLSTGQGAASTHGLST